MGSDSMTLGQKIKEARLARNLTQREVVGEFITRNMLSKIEHDSATPSVKTLEYLAGVLELPAGYFMSDADCVDEMTPEAIGKAREALRAKDYAACLAALEDCPPENDSPRDEMLLMQAQASLGRARQLVQDGELAQADVLLAQALDWNAQSLYGTQAFQAECLLLRTRCAVELSEAAFSAAREAYTQACQEQGLDALFHCTMAQRHLHTGELARARQALEQAADQAASSVCPEFWMLQGQLALRERQYQFAAGKLEQAVKLAAASCSQCFLSAVYAMLEECYKQLEDFKLAYYYASKQLELR